MRTILIVCTLLLVASLFHLPIGYYTFLRIVICITSVILLVTCFKDGIAFWTISFGLSMIVFNPIMPIYLNSSGPWYIIDMLTATLFTTKAITLNPKIK